MIQEELVGYTTKRVQHSQAFSALAKPETSSEPPPLTLKTHLILSSTKLIN